MTESPGYTHLTPTTPTALTVAVSTELPVLTVRGLIGHRPNLTINTKLRNPWRILCECGYQTAPYDDQRVAEGQWRDHANAVIIDALRNAIAATHDEITALHDEAARLTHDRERERARYRQALIFHGEIYACNACKRLLQADATEAFVPPTTPSDTAPATAPVIAPGEDMSCQTCGHLKAAHYSVVQDRYVYCHRCAGCSQYVSPAPPRHSTSPTRSTSPADREGP